jgi:microcystin-dependent protein
MANTTPNIPLSATKAPALPIAPIEYSQQYADQFNRILRLYFSQLDNFTQVLGGVQAGTTAERPGVDLYTGQPFFDTTLNTLVVWNGSAWVAAVPAAAGVSSFSAGSTGFTPNVASSGIVTLAGTLAIANGGTGLTSPGASGNLLTSNGSAWASTAPAPGVLTGTITMWATGTAPSGYLLCQGAAVSRITYSALFAVLGTTFGVGDNVTTFNLPNYTNRMPYGTTVGSTGGSADAIVVSHTHTASVSDPGHNHTFTDYQFANVRAGSNGGTPFTATPTPTTSSFTGITVSNSSTGVSGTNANIPPYLGINFIIKT